MISFIISLGCSDLRCMIWNQQDKVTGKRARALRSDQSWGNKTLDNIAGRVTPSDFQSGILLIHPEDWSRLETSADHQKTLSSCRDSATKSSGPAPLSRGQKQMVLRWVNSRLSVRLHREYQNLNYQGYQRMPCHLLPLRDQVAPIAVHSSDITAASQTALWVQAGSLWAGFSNA